MSGSSGEAPPVFEPPFAEPDGPDDEPVTVGVLLAAGGSARFGAADKLLATLDGEPLVAHAARTLERSAVDAAVAVVDPGRNEMRDALEPFDVSVVANDRAAAPQSASVGTGVRWARSRADAAVFALGDMPAVRPETVDVLLSAHSAGVGTCLAAGFDGRRGNPVLFDAVHFDALADLQGDVGGRRVFLASDGAAIVETDDPGTLRDVDTPEDLERVRG